MSEDSAVEVLVEGLQYLIPQAPILMLEPRLPLDGEVIPRVVDYLVEGRGFGGAPPVVLELLLGLFPLVAPEHAGLFGKGRLERVSEIGRIGIRIQARFQVYDRLSSQGVCGVQGGECNEYNRGNRYHICTDRVCFWRLT